MTGSENPRYQAALLPERGLLRLAGSEAVGLLQDILTADISSLVAGELRLAALLTPQGRILFDLLVSRDGDAVLLETDTAMLPGLQRKLMLYRMRRQVLISTDARPVHALIPANEGISLPETALQDSRFDDGTARFYGEMENAVTVAVSAWQAHRYLVAIPEGAAELPAEKALPLEAGLDRLGGVDFSKGCYIGQEVTARTHYRGLLKRRYQAVKLAAAVSTPAELHAAGRDAGTLFGCVETAGGVIGLASLRLGSGEVPVMTADNVEVEPLALAETEA